MKQSSGFSSNSGRAGGGLEDESHLKYGRSTQAREDNGCAALVILSCSLAILAQGLPMQKIRLRYCYRLHISSTSTNHRVRKTNNYPRSRFGERINADNVHVQTELKSGEYHHGT